jgi:hypothetical protein
VTRAPAPAVDLPAPRLQVLDATSEDIPILSAPEPNLRYRPRAFRFLLYPEEHPSVHDQVTRLRYPLYKA